LVDNGFLKYEWLNNFDVDMVHLIRDSHLLGSGNAHQLWVDEDRQLLAYERGGVIFVFNFHHSNSVTDFTFKVNQPGKYKIVLNSDDAEYGGHARIDNEVEHFTNEEGELSIYITNRTVIALRIS
jgi:1,4-alpha-glucan branching enzyme